MSIFLISGKVFAQTEIKDVVNIYTKVLSFDGLNAVNVTSSVGFGQGDTVMIAQMRGAIFSTDDPSVIDNPANTGKYELTVIGATPVGNKITFNSPLKNTYDNAEAVQLIRVPSYNHAKVVNKLTCSAWDGEKGGVLVLVANRSLTLNADIDVSGKGFSGKPAITFATGKCFSTSGVPYNTYNILNPSADSTSGLKGDGISTTKFVYTRGKGSAGNGGGAGSGSFTGGGGGGNYGLGGDGAIESCAGTGNSWGGMGGGIDPQYFSNVLSQRRIYLGGGGGSGIEKSSSSGSSGGDGGGVVILLTPYLITNNYFIRADGMDVTKLVTDGSSSGGGGGGGMVLLAVDSVKNKILSVSATGGNGGGTSGLLCEGHGGGGGGGFVWFSGKTMSFTSLDVSGGLAGQGNCDVSATAGYKGDSLNRLMLPLTGFLNNTIQAVPKTCYNTNVIIKASKPMGGNGVYTYLWEYRPYRTSTWLPAPGKNDTLGYKTSLLTDTVEFRRTVSSDGMNDVSRLLRIDVFPEIKLNSIDPDTTLCNGSPALKLRGKVATGGIGGITYEWGQRTISGTWEAAPGAAAGLTILCQLM